MVAISLCHTRSTSIVDSTSLLLFPLQDRSSVHYAYTVPGIPVEHDKSPAFLDTTLSLARIDDTIIELSRTEIRFGHVDLQSNRTDFGRDLVGQPSENEICDA